MLTGGTINSRWSVGQLATGWVDRILGTHEQSEHAAGFGLDDMTKLRIESERECISELPEKVSCC